MLFLSISFTVRKRFIKRSGHIEIILGTVLHSVESHIGTVEEVRLDDSGSASYAILIPSVEFDTLEEVFVIKSFEIVN